MADNYVKVGKTVARESGKHILNNLTPEQRYLFEQSMDRMRSAGLNPSKAHTKYALERATQGGAVESEWVRNALQQAYDRGAGLRAYRDQQARNAADLTRLRGLHGIDFLQRPTVQSALGGANAAYTAMRDNPLTTASVVAGIPLAYHAGYGLAEIIDKNMPTPETQARMREYLESVPPELEQYGRDMSDVGSDLDFDQAYGINGRR